MQGVVDEVLEHPVQPLAVRHDLHRRLRQVHPENQAALPDGVVQVRQGLPQELGEVQPLRMDRQLASGSLADLKHVLDHGRQAVGLLVDDAGVVRRCALQGLLPQQLRVGEDGGQGRFQVVGHIGDQLHLHPLTAGPLLQRAVQPRLDVVQGLRRLAQGRVSGQIQRRGQVPGADGLHLVGQEADVVCQGAVPPAPQNMEQSKQRQFGNDGKQHESSIVVEAGRPYSGEKDDQQKCQRA